jgi:large subunit ribosomal protein L10
LAISKEQKVELVELYKSWLNGCDGMVVTRHHGLTVRDISDLRAEIREAKGEFHIVKNTLAKIAFEEADRAWDEGYFSGPTALGVSFGNPSGLAKAIRDFAKESETLEIKGGYLEERMMSVEEVVALADLPTMSEMRAKLLQTILAPASQLTRILAEPGRKLAAVLKAYSEENAAGEAA